MTAQLETPAFRMTPQRAAILEVVETAEDHPTARDVYERVQALHPGIGVATVYRTLDLLVEHGAIQALQIGEDPVARYDGNTSRHDHVRCVGCGRLADVQIGVEPDASAAAARSTGFAISGYELTFTGRCPSCATD